MRRTLLSIACLFIFGLLVWMFTPGHPLAALAGIAFGNGEKPPIHIELSNSVLPKGAAFLTSFAVTSPYKDVKTIRFRWWVELYSHKGLEAKPYEGESLLSFRKGKTSFGYAVNRDTSVLWDIHNGKIYQNKASFPPPDEIRTWVGCGPTDMKFNEHYILALGLIGDRTAYAPADGFTADKNTVLRSAKENDWVYVLRGEFQE